MRAKVLSMSSEQRLAASAEIFRRVAESDVFRNAECVAVYISLPDEPQTDNFLARFAHLKQLVVPRVEGCQIEFCEYSPDRLQRGAFGIPEPTSDAPLCPADRIDLLILPGTAFTRNGIRMGRGGGFYDRYLSRTDLQAATVGVCFEAQIAESLPAEPHDIPVSMVITER